MSERLRFGLDPPGPAAFGVARQLALSLRVLLEDELDLKAFVKTTGGKGLHVHVPLDRGAGFDDVRDFARAVAGVLVRRYPDLATTRQRRAERSERVFVDIMRNAYAQTVVAPYSVRARPGAPVATPLHWDEVGDSALAPGRFTIRTISGRFGREPNDPWKDLPRTRQGLRRARKRVGELGTP